MGESILILEIIKDWELEFCHSGRNRPYHDKSRVMLSVRRGRVPAE
jgi:hypothetical protein